MFNHSWMKGVVPAVWKEAVIIPVPKKGKHKKNPRSYSPISLVSCAGKLLERIVNRRLLTTWRATVYYRELKQDTEVPKHRGPTCLPCPDIGYAFQEKTNVLEVFFDLSNAFDKI